MRNIEKDFIIKHYSSLLEIGIPTFILEDHKNRSFFLQEGVNFEHHWDYEKELSANQKSLLYKKLKLLESEGIGCSLLDDLEGQLKFVVLQAMDLYKAIAQELIEKLITETDQPGKDAIKKGHYYEIENAELFNGESILSDNWDFDMHGEHCRFENILTGQTLEVSLSDEDGIGNLDPYFFYDFLRTTDRYKYLIDYFERPFQDMCDLFEELVKEGSMLHISSNSYRKL